MTDINKIFDSALQGAGAMKPMGVKIRAAEALLGALLGARNVQEKIPLALEKACPGWTKEEVLELAEHLSFTRGLAAYRATDPYDHTDLEYFLAIFTHDTFVGEELQRYLGDRRPISERERAEFLAETMVHPHPWLAGTEPTEDEREIVPSWWFERYWWFER